MRWGYHGFCDDKSKTMGCQKWLKIPYVTLNKLVLKVTLFWQVMKRSEMISNQLIVVVVVQNVVRQRSGLSPHPDLIHLCDQAPEKDHLPRDRQTKVSNVELLHCCLFLFVTIVFGFDFFFQNSIQLGLKKDMKCGFRVHAMDNP